MDALQFFLVHHQRLHSMVERDFLKDSNEQQMRYRPGENMNSRLAGLANEPVRRCGSSVLIGARPQVLDGDSWLQRLNISPCDVGTGMGDDEVLALIHNHMHRGEALLFRGLQGIRNR